MAGSTVVSALRREDAILIRVAGAGSERVIGASR